MRVLWLTPDKPANISVGRRRIADHLRREGIDVTLRGTTTGTVRESLRDVGAYDVLVGTTRAGAIAGTLLQAVGGVPFVVDHVDPIRQFGEAASAPVATGVRLLENLAFHRADHVLYVYDEETARVERYARAATKTALGVEYDQFAEPSDRALAAARERLEDEPLAPNVAVYVGGLEPIYHVEEMLEAVARLEDWSLVVVGTGSLADRVRTVAAREEEVVYLGTVAHELVPGYLRAADVGVSLVDDPHTLKVLEYGAAGLSVVQLSGRASDRFEDLVTYTPADPADIAAAIERAAGRDPDGLRAFAARFDWAEVAATYRDVLTAVTGG
jgi:glycosyltransferase involved in cell wall biosynthesis